MAKGNKPPKNDKASMKPKGTAKKLGVSKALASIYSRQGDSAVS